MDEVLSATAHGAVLERLDYLDTLVAHADEPSRAALAASKLPRLTSAWRALLDRHRPDERGRWPHCQTPVDVRRSPPPSHTPPWRF